MANNYPCGSCGKYDEWRNGYCKEKNKNVEPEDECCGLYQDEDGYMVSEPWDV